MLPELAIIGGIGLLQSIHKMRTKRAPRYFRSEHRLPLLGGVEDTNF